MCSEVRSNILSVEMNILKKLTRHNATEPAPAFRTMYVFDTYLIKIY